MSDDSKEQETGFKITDRRLFTQEGELRQEAQPQPEPTEPQSQPEARRPADPERPKTRSAAGERRPETPQAAEDEEMQMDFTSFALSLATSAMMQMGEIPDPMTGRPVENLQAARQTIDILNLLKDKTKGNLTPDENRVIDGLLYELRLKYLSKSKVIKF
jgi:hypothetical protein